MSEYTIPTSNTVTTIDPHGTCWGAQQRIDELAQQLNAANERIKRLESVENSHSDVLKAIDKWIKQNRTKEEKP